MISKNFRPTEFDMHRRILLSTIAKFVDREESSRKNRHGRPVWMKRWKFVPEGLVYVREEIIEQNGRKRTILKGPVTDCDEIARILFGPDATAKDMTDVKTILEKLRENRSYLVAKVVQEWKRIATRKNLEMPNIHETVSAGATAAGSIAMSPFPLGGIIRRRWHRF